MASDDRRPATDGGTPSPGSRDLLLIGLAILALIVAAFALPPIGASAGGAGSAGPGGESPGTDQPRSTPSASTPSTPDDARTPSDGGTPTSNPREGDREDVRLEPGEDQGQDGEVSLNLTRDAGEPHAECFVVVWDRLVPGRDATVIRWQDGRYATDRRVWFEDRTIGRTDGDGRVDGRVPYVRELSLTAAVGEARTCHVVALDMETSLAEWRAENGPPRLVVDDTDSLETVEATNGNVTTTLPVEGEATVAVEGEPYPGETVVLNATVGDAPMRSATVTADGRAVGETVADGRYELTIPDDGSDRVSVAVSRGEFTAETTIDVLLLSVAVRPAGPLAVPGGDATVLATVGDEPAENVTVSIGGETVGRTGADGRVAIDLPTDVRATVEASGHGQMAQASIWPVYLPTFVVLLVLLGTAVGSVLWARRRGATRTAQGLVGGWLALGALAIVGLVWGRRGVAVALAGGLLVGTVLAATVYRAAIRRGIARALESLRAGLAMVRHLALRVADGLGRLADRVLALARWVLGRLGDLPRSLRGLLAVVVAQLAAIPGLIALGLRRLGTRVGRWFRRAGRGLATLRGVATLVVTVGAGAVGYRYADVTGALLAAGVVLAAVGIGYWLRSSRDEDGTAFDVSSATAGPEPVGGGTEEDDEDTSRVSLRTLWRTFARWVVPGRVRSRTPGEVARAAVDRGFPREPVDGLTEAFREVEYGDRAPTQERLGRARAAFEALRTERTDEERGEQ